MQIKVLVFLKLVYKKDIKKVNKEDIFLLSLDL